MRGENSPVETSEELQEAVARLRGWVATGTSGGLKAEREASRRRFVTYIKAALVSFVLTVGTVLTLALGFPKAHLPAAVGISLILSLLLSPALGLMAVLPGLNWLSLKRLSRPATEAERARLTGRT